MTSGQTTVLGLLVVLLALEGVRNPSVKTFLSGALKNFTTAINSGAKPSGS